MGQIFSAPAAGCVIRRNRRLRSRPRRSPNCEPPPTGTPPTSGPPEGSRKTIDHPQVGALTLDCDVLTGSGPDLCIMIYTAEPGTQDAERLALIGVLGTQSLVGESNRLPQLDFDTPTVSPR
ncbi:MAG: hypothetical protein ABWY45_05315 [Mycobacterium sp.]